MSNNPSPIDDLGKAVPCKGSQMHSDRATYDQMWCLAAGRYCKHAPLQACQRSTCSFCGGLANSMRSGESDVFNTCSTCAAAWDHNSVFAALTDTQGEWS